MNSQQDVIYGLMNELEEALDKGFPLLGYCFTVVKKDTVTNILDKLYAALPDEIKEVAKNYMYIFPRAHCIEYMLLYAKLAYYAKVDSRAFGKIVFKKKS